MTAPPPINKPASGLPVHFALLLFPTFQALDVFGPFDALNTIKRLYPSVPLRLSILSTTLHPVSTLPIPPDSPNFIPFEQKISPTHTYASPPSQPIDIIFIPGGIGTRQDEPGWKPVVSYLNAYLSTPSLVKNLKGIFTVCTGSFLLGRSKLAGGTKGTLDGVHATTNKQAFFSALEELKEVIWEPKARWVRTSLSLPLSVDADTSYGGGPKHTVKLWTTSGVSAGTDGMFAFIAEEYGEDVVKFIAINLEYRRVTDPSDDPFAVHL